MIVERSTHVARVVRASWARIALAFLIVIAVELVYDAFSLDRPIFSFSALALVVTALSIFLVFRVNEAYSRWWEARTLWGGIVNSSRNFGRQVTAFVGPPSDGSAERHEVASLHEELVYRQMAWLHALRLSLRREEDWDQLAPYLADEELEASLMKSSRRCGPSRASRPGSCRPRPCVWQSSPGAGG
jgi:putative membrane protein